MRSWPDNGARPGLDGRGMTLVEIMVVMLLLAGMMMGAGYGISAVTRSDLRKEAMMVTAAIKHSHNTAAMNNTRYRMVFDLDTGEYHTEVTDSAVLVEEPTGMAEDEEGLLPEEARELEEQHRAENDLFDEAEADPFGLNRKVTFNRVQDGLIKPRKLQPPMRFVKIMTRHQQIPFEKGKATVSFYPDGSMEPALITIGDDSGAFYTLLTEPLTGRIKIYSADMEIPDDFGLAEMDDGF